MALASLEPLGCVKPARAATFCGFYALAVNHASGRDQVSIRKLPGAPHQHEVDPPPDPLVAPEIKIVLDCRARRKMLWQRAPLATRPQNIKNGIDHLAHINLPRPPEVAWHFQERRQPQPFCVSQVACITKVIASMLRTGDFSPRHRVLPRISQIRRNHKGLESPHSFSASLSG